MHIQFLYFDVILFIYEYFTCLCICMSHAYSVFANIRGHYQILWHWIMYGCEPPCESWELNLDSLQEQLVFLTFEPSLQRLEFSLRFFFKIFIIAFQLCVQVCAHVWVLLESRRGYKIPGRLCYRSAALCGYWEPNCVPLESSKHSQPLSLLSFLFFSFS